ncbi:SPOR domain-containing protein [Aquincola sp. MAHUQ-54]|uniref:SPOR domain-containing protein n=1 Tax=Aquincola agrisoli TaxID=3119538 RepID=A0AAW9QN15_9BURK
MKSQRGGFVMGLIVGLLLGLALALGVALYVTKVPVPFVNKVPQRSADQDAAEAEKNKNWDPNAPLSGRPTQRAASGTVQTPVYPAQPAVPAPTPEAPAAAASTRDPAAILSGQDAAPAAPPAAARSARTGPDAFTYFVQAGAFARPEDAEQQRARLAMQGLAARVTEREQSGRTVYRVRLGPYEHRDDAESAQQRLQGSGVEAALVRVER